MPDSETICGCNGVRKGEIIHAIHEYGITTLALPSQQSEVNPCLGATIMYEQAGLSYMKEVLASNDLVRMS
jgi:hypothetical protein